MFDLLVVQDQPFGSLEKWLVKEGDNIKVGDVLCHVSVNDVLLGVESQQNGILAQLKFPEGTEQVKADEIIAIVVDNKEEYTKFLQLELKAVKAKQQEESDTDEEQEKKKKADVKDLLREIKILINKGEIQEESGMSHVLTRDVSHCVSEFAKKLLSLARKGHQELLDVFEASFESHKSKFTDQTAFDSNFFLDNAKDIVEEAEEQQRRRDKKK